MARRKKQSVLNLPAPPQLRVNGELTVPGSSLGAKRTLTRAEEATIDEFCHQKLVEYAVKQKTVFGESMIAEINRHGNHVFNETLDEIMANKSRKRENDHQAIVDEFTQYQTSLLAQGILSAIEGGSTSVLEEILRPLYIEVKEEQPPKSLGFFDWLLGRY